MTPDQFTAHQIDHLYRAEADRIAVWEDTDSVRSPGWYQASCHECDWETSGRENTVEDAAREHVGTHPLGALLSAVSDAVRERGEKLERLPEILGAIWSQEKCASLSSGSDGMIRCEEYASIPHTHHRTTASDGQSRSWTDNEGYVEVGYGDTGLVWGSRGSEWPPNP